ncbi:MAG TPA: hypothetical protein GXX50_10300 [Firmicutes bacterium]|nr:hypothetical protein [Bacillota bacterium]
MTVCDRGRLMAYLDGELAADQQAELEAHLRTCSSCRADLAELRAEKDSVSRILADYEAQLAQQPFRSDAAWRRWCTRRERHGWKNSRNTKQGVREMFYRARRGVAAAAACALVAGALSFAPFRAAAANFLQVFRVERLQAVEVSRADIESVLDELRQKGGAASLGELGRVETVQEGSARKISSWAEAGRVLGRELPVPKLPAPLGLKEEYAAFDYSPAFTLSFTLTPKMNEVLQALGSRKLLPAAVLGKKFSLHFPGLVRVHYARPRQDKAGPNQPYYLSLAFFNAPELRVPEGVDVEELRSILLDLPILPSDLRQRLAAVRDWQHTLPVPNLEGGLHEVRIGDTTGLGGEEHGQVQLMWQRGGLWHLLNADNLSLEQATAIAASLE